VNPTQEATNGAHDEKPREFGIARILTVHAISRQRSAAVFTSVDDASAWLKFLWPRA
jgi:hypothetical protein